MEKIKKIKKIAIVLDPRLTFGQSITEGVARYALECGQWAFHTTGGIPYISSELAFEWRGDGMIGAIGARLQAYLRKQEIPFVNVSTQMRALPIPSVVVDNAMVGSMAAEHLMEKGLEHFAVATWEEVAHLKIRKEAFCKRLAREGYACDHVSLGRVERFGELVGFNSGQLEAYLRALENPIGVFALQDPIGRGVIETAQQLNLRVPEDVAVMGEGNWHFICDMVSPPLTSIDIGADRIGYRSAQLLDEIMHGKKPPRRSILVPPRGVIARQSTDVLAVHDEELCQAIRFIRENVNRPIQVEDLLEVVPINRRTLEKRFRKHLGRSIHEEIRRTRIQRACLLLRQTDMVIGRIHQACGYTAQDRFNAAFRQEKAMTPSQYRRKYQ